MIGPAKPSPRSRKIVQRGAFLKRIILAPFLAITLCAILISWAIYIQGSRLAITRAVDSIARDSVERVATDIAHNLDVAMSAAMANASLLSRTLAPQGGGDGAALQSYFLDQLDLYPKLALIGSGFADGTYAEAQRLEDGSLRVALAGERTGGSLDFRMADAAPGSPPMLSRPGYDPRQRPWYLGAAAGPHWSEPYQLYSNGDQAISAAAPIRDGQGRLLGVTNATFVLSRISSMLSGYKEAANGVFFITDTTGRLIARSLGPEGALDAEGFRPHAATHEHGDIAQAAHAAAIPKPGEWADASGEPPRTFSFSIDGRAYRGYSVPYANRGLSWSVVGALRLAAYTEDLIKADARIAVLLIGFVALSAAASLLVGAYVARPLNALIAGADTMELGAEAPAGFAELARGGNEIGKLAHSLIAMKRRLDQSYSALERGLIEKEVLLKEVHHRVKNNLQIVSSMLSLQSGTLRDDTAKTAFEECQSRIQAMALVHEEVYREGYFDKLDIGIYIGKICDTLRIDRYGSGYVSIRADVQEGVYVGLDAAIPIGLIVNELVTNSIKYAFPDGRGGSVTVSFREENGLRHLSVADDGTGMPDLSDREEGVGSQLIQALASQLRGTIHYTQGDGVGTLVSAVFPIVPAKIGKENA